MLFATDLPTAFAAVPATALAATPPTAAIAGIIIAVGTGVDHQIVITDEILNKEKKELLTWKQKIKKVKEI